jgi:excisionase family DNA binding protein
MTDQAEPAAAERQLPRLMSVNEAAAYFNRTARTVNRWIANGTLSAVRVGRGKFVLLDEVEELISAQISDRLLRRSGPEPDNSTPIPQSNH